jgi:hypothetical protein
MFSVYALYFVAEVNSNYLNLVFLKSAQFGDICEYSL